MPKQVKETVDISGTFSYARILEPLTSIRRKTGEIEPLDNPRYSITVEPDAASLKLIKEKSITTFTGEDGKTVIQATKTVWTPRPGQQPEPWGIGSTIIVKDASYKEGEWIGNGSKGKIRCTLYDRKGTFDKGLNLVKVLLEEWKPVDKEAKKKIVQNEEEKAKSVSKTVIESEMPF